MRTILTAVLVLAACGDNPGTPDAAAPAPDGPVVEPARAVIVSGDFAATGILSTLDLPERTMTQNAVAGVAGVDPVIRHIGNRLYVVNRAGGDNVTILTDDTLTLVDQISTGAGTNPQDVAVIGDRLYVAALAATGVIVIDRAAGNARSEIDLSILDAVDGHPDCVSVFAVDTRVFVACGLLDATFMARGPGKVAIIDTTGANPTAVIDLPAANPTGLFARTPPGSAYAGDLVLGTVPSYTDFSMGCLARVSTGPTPAASCGTTNQELGGYANHLEASPEGTLLWITVDGFTVPNFAPFGALRGIDLATGELWPWSVSPTQQVIVDVAVCPAGIVVVTDSADSGKGVRVYDNTVEVTTAPMAFGLPPAYGGNMVCYRR